MEELLALAAQQLGLFTARQWTAAGFSRRSLTYRKTAGLVNEIQPGVFALAGAPAGFEQSVLAACLSVGGVASHRCAAYLWGFRRFETPVAEVLVQRGRTPALDDITVRRTGHLHPADVDKVRGIPVTGRVRTLLDVCDVSPKLAEGAINGSLHRRWTSVGQLQGVLGRVGPKHPGLVRYRELVRPFTEGQRPTESELEDDFLELVIRRYKLPEPVRQHPVGGDRIDFAYPELVLGIEIDSVRGHAAREDVDRNAAKANKLLKWAIVHFVYNDIHLWPGDTAAFLGQTIAERRRAA